MAKRYIDRLAWGTDAGFYRLIPEEILTPSDENEIVSILARARKEGKTITFRAAGTSLSGQAISDSLLVVCGKKWERYEVLDEGLRVRVQPGIRGGRVNEILAFWLNCIEIKKIAVCNCAKSRRDICPEKVEF